MVLSGLVVKQIIKSHYFGSIRIGIVNIATTTEYLQFWSKSQSSTQYPKAVAKYTNPQASHQRIELDLQERVP